MSAHELIEGGDRGLLLLCDHASDRVPDGVDLDVPAEVMARHVAIDIGAGPLTRALAAALDAPAILATVSRLVIDLHREPDHPALIPVTSDGHSVPGNERADRRDRIARFHAPYHRTIAGRIRAQRPGLLLSIHSFTPRLETAGADRPWEIGILYNRDDRAARHAIAWLEGQGLRVGDNEPYSGQLLNATLNRHGEANGIPSVAIEIRNDLISDAAGVARWRDILASLARELRNRLAFEAPSAT